MRLTLLATLALPSLALAQGALTPPSGALSGGAPTATMKSLDQIEARTPIGEIGGSLDSVSIDAPGSYVLLGNIEVRAGNAITINASNVTLDLNGFTLSSTASPADGYGIYIRINHQNVVVRNGHISGTGTVNPATGSFSGAGFTYGIICSDTLPNCLVSDLTISGISATGIHLDVGSTIDRCAVTACGDTGIHGQAVTNCSATSCGTTAIAGTTVSNSQGSSVTGPAIIATTAANCTGISTSGIGLQATQTATGCTGTTQTGDYGLCVATSDETPVPGTAENCKGAAASGTGAGLFAGTASNCIGTSFAGTGLQATQNATNCFGTTATGNIGLWAGDDGYNANAENCRGIVTGITSAATGTGLAAGTATHCFGQSISSTGLYAEVATDCKGTSTAGNGLVCVGTATGCIGTSTSGIGLSTFNAANCRGTTDTGDYGLLANDTAQGSYGHIQTVGDADSRKHQDGSFKPPACGLKAQTANTCVGTVTTAGRARYDANFTPIPASIGLSAETADDCRGAITSSGGDNLGLQASDTATNCKGTITNGTGLSADIATNCQGTSASSIGLVTDTANNCYGKTQTGNCGMLVTGSATNCRGDHTGGGKAIRADIAVSCTAERGTVNGTNRYNMP